MLGDSRRRLVALALDGTMIAVKPLRAGRRSAESGNEGSMNAPVQTTVGELIAVLFDETRNLNWLKTHEKQLLVALILNDLVRQSSEKNHRSVSRP